LASVQNSALWEVDPELFGPPVAPARKPDSWDHSPEFDAQYRKSRARRRGRLGRSNRLIGTVADPEEISSEARRKAEAHARYFSGESTERRGGDPRLALPEGNDLRVLAETFGASPERLAQAVAMHRRSLGGKAKRLVLCGRIGHRVNCSESSEHRFLQRYLCHTRYCDTCGPAWFRQQFSVLSTRLEPVIEHLFHEGQKRGREMVIAKLDFTTWNTGGMPEPQLVRKFHREMNDFFDLLCRLGIVSRTEYGVGGQDEFGGSNTNLHRHSFYVGPVLPQKNRELSALWSIVALPKERKREMLRFVRKYGLYHAWDTLAGSERRFVSIKRARSFRAALAHALKYPAKFLSASTPERLAQLEAVFHKTRRFSTGGAFYRVKVEREPGEDSPIGCCPICGARLCEVVEPWVPIFDLETEGRADVEQVRREMNRARALSGSGPP
jgi:hypothetical protein